MDDELSRRIRRMYAAIGATEERDPTKLRATVISTQKFKGMFQDFRGGLTDERLENAAYTMIHNIAHLRDHLRKWATRSGNEKNRIDVIVKQSLDLQIMLDLSNNDKHGYPRRDHGESGRSPKLIEINRVMQLATKAKAGSSIAMALRADGTPVFLGDGSAKAVITGDVVDKDGNRIGDLYEIANKAVIAWEALLSEFKIITDSSSS